MISLTFKQYLIEQEYNDYSTAIDLLETGELNEGIFDKLSSSIKHKITFIKELAKTSSQDVSKVIKLLKNKEVFKFFQKISFSMKKLFSLLKKGYKLYSKLEKIIADYISETKFMKNSKEYLSKLDDYLNNHPTLKQFGGIAVGALLIYIWLNMSFTPDLSYSMDFTDILSALGGSFSLADIFSGPEGIKLLTYFASGALLGLSFPWPGPTSIQFVGGVLFSLGHMFKVKFTNP